MSRTNDSIDKLSNYPFSKLLKIIIGVVGVVLAITIFILTYYYNNQINELNATIGRLLPISGQSNSINLSSFFVYRNDSISENISSTSVFDSDNLIYYSKDNYWNHDQMNPVQFINFLSDSILTENQLDFEKYQSLIWHSDFQIELNNNDYLKVLSKTNPLFKVDSTYTTAVSVLVPKPRFLKQYIKLTRLINETSFIKTRDLVNDYKVLDSISFRNLGFKYLSSTFIEQIFNDLYSNLPKSIAFTEINNISMQNNWLYLSSISVFGKKHISDDHEITIYCFNEWYIFYTELNTYILEVQTPSFEPLRRGNQFVELNSWLSKFKVVMK